jgi:hypothetical protein
MANSNSDHLTSDSIDLIDIVFTAMVTVGLTPEILQVSHINGMLSESWVKAALAGTPQAPSTMELLDLGAFLLGLFTLLLSWFGIHASLQANPIHYDTNWGMLRFVLDVTLVLLYGVILIFFRQLHAVLFLLSVVYLLYVVWDIFKTLEYRDSFWSREILHQNRIKWIIYRCWVKACRPKGRQKEFSETAKQEALDHQWHNAPVSHVMAVAITFQRQLVSLLFAISFVSLWLMWSPARASIALGLAIAWTILYRVSKAHPVGGSIMTIFSWLLRAF